MFPIRSWFRTASPARPPWTTRLTLEQLEERRLLSVTYHGGTLLKNVSIEPVYYGKDWNNASLFQQASNLNGFLSSIANSSYMDMLNEYGVGRGSLVDGGIIDNGVSAGQTVDDTQIQQMLAADINGGSVVAPNANRLYVVFTAPKVTVTSSGQNSVRDFYGYHNAFVDGLSGTVYYAVIVHPVGNGDFYNLDDFETLTKVASHELAESVTDPAALTNLALGGWFGKFAGYTGDQEIGDVANNQYDVGKVNGYVVQAEWSQKQGTNVLPADAQLNNDFALSGAANSPPTNLTAIASLFTHSSEHYADLIQYDYQHYLGRPAMTTEVNSWVNAMQAGATDEQVLAIFIGSPEYYLHTGGTNSDWVKAMYSDLLGRSPAPQEVNGWVQDMALGMGRAQIAGGFATSWEAESMVVKTDYEQYLGRQATDAEVAGWVNAFEHGVTNEQVVAGFVGSAEYYDDLKKGHGDDAGWISSAYQDILRRAPSDTEVNGWYQDLVH